MKKGLILVLAFILALGLKGQPPMNFQSCFGGEGDDIGFSAKATLDDNYIITGLTSSFGNDNTDVYLVKLSSMGQGIWQEHIGGSGIDVGKSVIIMPDSGFVIAGFTTSFGAGGYDAYLFRTNKFGKLIWQQTFGTADWDFACDVTLSGGGNLFMVGYSDILGKGREAFIVKFDTSGTFKSAKYFGGIMDDEFSAIISTNDNNVAVVGYTKSGKDSNGNGLFMKLNLNLDTIFRREVGGPHSDYLTDLLERGNGNYDLCGAATYSSGGFTNSAMFGYSAVGDSLWGNNYNQSNGDEHFVAVGKSYQSTSFTGYLRNYPFPTLKIQPNIVVTNPNGWYYLAKSFGGQEDDFLYSLEGTKDGGYFGVGKTLSFGSSGQDVFVVKIDSTIVNYAHIEGLKKNGTLAENIKLKYLTESEVCFEIPNDTKVEEICLFSAQGVRIRSNNLTSCLRLSDLPSGIYIVEILCGDNQFWRRKIIHTETH